MRLIDKDELVDRLTELAELNREWKPEFSEFCDEMVCLVEDSPFWEREDFDDSFLRPKGEWIYNTDDFTPKKRCTNCGYNKPLVAGEAIKQEPDNYCPNCGADMRGETHDS